MSVEFFKENGYQVIRKMIDPKNLYSHLANKKDQELFSRDGQVAGSQGIYKEMKCEELLLDLLPRIEECTGYKLYKTYSYTRMYELDNILKAHTDRNACEISATISLGYEDKPWPISIFDKDQRVVSVLLEPGDALIYKGTEIMHWREKNIYGRSSQVFLHYVDQNGPHANLKDDNGPKAKRYHYNMNLAKFNINLNLAIKKVQKSETV